MDNDRDFTNIEELPVNPQKSGVQAPVIADMVNISNQSQAMNNSLDFPEEFKTDLNNIVIDEQAHPTYSNKKEDINVEKKVRFNVPETINTFDENSHLNNLYINDVTNKYKNLNPVMQLIVLASILYFIFLNPLIKENLIKILNQINILKVTSEDGNLNIIGKIIFAMFFGVSLFFLIQFIHASSLQIVF